MRRNKEAKRKEKVKRQSNPLHHTQLTHTHIFIIIISE
jgi:hypothetical protein